MPSVTIASDWPEPGGRSPAPNAALHRLQDFVNTNDIEAGTDELEAPQQLHDWLVASSAIEADDRVTRDAHARALAVREGLRALGLANNGEALEEESISAMNHALRRSSLIPEVTDSATWRLAPAAGGVDGYLARLMSTVVAAMADGSWSRVKACRNDACQWLFFDQSKNRSGTWCSMAECGSVMKARAYRARRREEHPAT
jgi:predicted RNA-binding Zn ribbon-like protein